MPRPVAHLANLDLNLLVALRDLLRERSVTRAAERLGVTQPAASAAAERTSGGACPLNPIPVMAWPKPRAVPPR